ncbi:MAG: hypothetical protein U9O95_07150 [Candidatus Marinimicrobia bacterium]|nr:hypothetical protein [Candidatus Neomarinimicrobiota bacterium]
MRPKVNSLNILMLMFALFLFFSCSTFNESVLEPEKGSFLIPAIFLEDPIGDLGFKIPKTAIQMLKNKSRGSVIKSENINGLDKFDAISVIITKRTLKYVYVIVDDENDITLNKNDAIINYVPESLIKINETNHEFLVEAFKHEGD